MQRTLQIGVVGDRRDHGHAAAAPMVFTGLVRLGQDGEWALFTATAVVVAVLLTGAVGYQVRVHREVADKHRDARVKIGLGDEASGGQV